jgi:hypothetical protein
MKPKPLFALMLFAFTSPVVAEEPTASPIPPKYRQLAADVQAAGGTIAFFEGEPVSIELYYGANRLKGKGGLNTNVNDAWLAKLAGLTTVTTLNIANCDVHRAGMKHVATMTGLQFLNLTLTPTVDEDLEPLAALKELQSISLASTECTGEAFAKLKGLTKLNNLNMHHTPANDAGMAAVAGVGALERLWVAHCHFTDAAGPSFATHKNLHRMGIGSKEPLSTGAIITYLKELPLVELELFDNQSSEEGVIHAAAIPTLKLLSCGYAPRVTDAALDAVAKMPALETFSIAGAKLTDEGLQKLAAVKTLKTVKLGKMKGVTAEGVAKLRAARPDLTVESPQ